MWKLNYGIYFTILYCRPTIGIRSRNKLHPNTISEEYEGDMRRRPLVKTQFVAWSCKKFAQTSIRESPLSDYESKAFYEREWRYIRYLRIFIRKLSYQFSSSCLISFIISIHYYFHSSSFLFFFISIHYYCY